MSDGDKTREQLYEELRTLRTELQQADAKRRRSEQKLRDCEEAYRAVVEPATDGLITVDEAGTVLSVNRAAEAIFGFGARELIRRNITALVPEALRMSCGAGLAPGPAGGVGGHRCQGVRLTGLHKSGREIPLEISSGEWARGGMRRFTLAVRDVSERVAFQTERERLLERLRQQIDRLPLAYIQLDADNRVIDWNPAAEGMFGYTREEISGRVVFDLIVPPPARERVRGVIRRVWAGDMDAHSVNENRTKGGRTIICQWFNTPLTDADGRFAGVISLAQDVTERRRAEQALEQYAARLQALTRRLAEVQEEERRRLADDLHDEIGQILTSLKFALEAGASAPPDTAGAKLGQARALIEEALNRIRALSFDLRPALLDHLGLLPALRGMIERYTASTGVRVNFGHAGLGGRFASELETAAFRIVQEALTNVARHARVREAAVRVWVDDGSLVVQVEDQGVGFDPEAALACGCANGLAGLHDRARSLGGRLVIESGLGEGTHLLAELPLAGDSREKIVSHFQRLGR